MNLFKRGATIVLMFLFIVGTAHAAITDAAIVTNLSSSDRIPLSTNGTFNISFTESVGTNYTNISFPSEFNISGLLAINITNNTGSALTLTKSGTWANISYTAVASGGLYFNFTSKVTSPSASGTYQVNITTNATNTTTTVKLCARDNTKPFLIKSNNSVFTVTCGTPTETFGSDTTSVTLTGSGNANLTFWIPSISGQTNITAGWGATNATVIRSNSTLNTSYVETNPSVTNPVITLSAQTEFESGNLPAAITATAISGLVVVYAYLRRRRRH